jgi:type II secretory pathway predicted ATPase ExeA
MTGMTDIVTAMHKAGISQRKAAADLGISPAAVNLIINKGIWPRTDTEAVKARFTAWARSLGVTDIPLEDTAMIRKQTLTHKARRVFSITRDPFTEHMEADDVFMSRDQRYVLEMMTQCAVHGGMLAVIGESGSGKSTLRRMLLHNLAGKETPVTVIQPYVIGLEDNDIQGKSLKAMHIAEAILHQLAPSQRMPRSSEGRFRLVHQVLKDSRRAGNRHVLIIEEAHSLNAHTIKHLKRFYELEGDGFDRLLSIILIGQSELREKLSETNAVVREVVQRCDLVEIHPIEDVAGYVKHRCAGVGLDAGKLFASGALDLLPGKLSGPQARRGQAGRVSLLYPLAVGNMLTLALNAAADAGESIVTADILQAV